MKATVGAIFSEFAHILGICPRCGALFRLGDVRPYLIGKRPHSILDDLDAAEARIDRAMERLDEQEAMLRARAKEAGLKQAKRQLRKIDPIFSGSNLDPQDVRVIFDPVEYVVFDGMQREHLRRILLLGHPPASREAERVQRSLSRAIGKGNVDFKTLRVTPEGALELR
jgi:predicted Holliday junction resolvase-like endonuclease